MMPFAGRPAWRARAMLAAGTLAVAGLVLLVARDRPDVPRSETDARIEYYRSKVGGRGTYPASARLGLAYLQKARETGQPEYYDRAQSHLEESLRQQPNYDALRGLSIAYLSRHQFPEAVKVADEAAATDPGDLDAQGARFDAHLAIGDATGASAILETMGRADVGFIFTTRLANLRQFQGDIPGALAATVQSCADAEKRRLSADRRAWCQVRLGSLHLLQCDVQAAERAFQLALQLFPDYYLALDHLADLRAGQGRRDEAIAIYHALVEKTADPHVRWALSAVYAADGRRQDAEASRALAIEELRSAAAGGSRAEWRPLSLLLLEDEATAAEGLQWAERDWQNRRDPFAADTLAWAYYRMGRLADAAPMADLALASGTRDTLTLLHAAEIRLATKRPSEARALAERALACAGAIAPPDYTQAERVRALLGIDRVTP